MFYLVYSLSDNVNIKLFYVPVCVTGLWTFLWFVNFRYLTDTWRRTSDPPGQGRGVSGVEAAIAFSFFSIITFVSWFNL